MIPLLQKAFDAIAKQKRKRILKKISDKRHCHPSTGGIGGISVSNVTFGRNYRFTIHIGNICPSLFNSVELPSIKDGKWNNVVVLKALWAKRKDESMIERLVHWVADSKGAKAKPCEVRMYDEIGNVMTTFDLGTITPTSMIFDTLDHDNSSVTRVCISAECSKCIVNFQNDEQTRPEPPAPSKLPRGCTRSDKW